MQQVNRKPDDGEDSWSSREEEKFLFTKADLSRCSLYFSLQHVTRSIYFTTPIAKEETTRAAAAAYLF